MTQVAFGILCDKIGAAGKHVLEQGPTRPELRFESWSSPSTEYRSVQAAQIPVDQEHDGYEVGQVLHLERDRAQNLWCVAELRDDINQHIRVKVGNELVLLEQPLFWSARHWSGGGSGIELESVALTVAPARVAPRPIKILPGGGFDYMGATRRWRHLLKDFENELLERACTAHVERRRAGYPPLVIQGEREQQQPLELRRTDPVEIRSATPLDVHVSRRELDVLICPAEQPTVIHEPTRSYVEVMSHGAFAGCEREPEKVKVNLYHVRERLLGKAVRLDPWSEDGLTGTLRLAKTAAADEALQLIDDDLLDISAGFAIGPNGAEWSADRKSRRVKRAILHHVGLVDQAAYPSARILAARSRAVV